ncbi:MAG: histidine phosphatase family protein, partial [Candidatus Rokubacteria bacterium]|nr:histidine phosphatase family protein [Candidatus Rokubacteria bacterium]
FFPEMQARVVAALERLCERHPGETVVAVSHGDPIKAAVAHALGVPLDLFNRIVVAPASVTAIAFRPEGPVVLTVNSSDGELGGLGG